jgi:gluconolactonase
MIRTPSTLLLMIGFTFPGAPGGPLPAADTARPSGDPAILPAEAALSPLWNEGEFTEGVAAAPDGTIYFSDIPRGEGVGRILRFDPQTGQTTTFSADSGKSNGLMFDRAGRLIACCGSNSGLRALCEFGPDGQPRVLVDAFEGRRLNSPNDLVIHPDGSIYFSDPRYIGDEPMDLDHMSVYRYQPAADLLQRVTHDITKPNGVILSPDGRTLYVAETDNGAVDARQPPPQPPQVRMTLNALPILADGTLGPKRVLTDYGTRLGIDGMTVDEQGHVYGALRSDDRHGIVVYAADGTERAFLPTNELPTNCCFGRGPDASTLYVTAGGGLYRIGLKIKGHHSADAPR